MPARRLHRTTTTVLVVLALLFSQLALANHVCPIETGQGSTMPVMEMAPGAPCEEEMAGAPDQGQPVLCQQHCQNAPQSFDPVGLPAVSLPAVMQVLVVPVAPDEATTDYALYATVGEARAPPDPLFLSTLRLRV